MESKKEKLAEIVKNKSVLFVTTKNIDYIRNTQEIGIIKKYSKECQLIYSYKKRYVKRIIEVWIRLALYNMENIDVIVIGFAPQFVLPFYYFKMRKKTVVIDFFISIYDTLIFDRKVFKAAGVIARLSHWIDFITLKMANHIIVDTRADAQYFIKEFKCNRNKFEIIYLEADPLIYYPRKQCKRRELSDKFVVLYFGSILPLQGVDIVLEAIFLLKEEKNIFFQIIGPIPKNYRKPIQENVEYIQWLEQGQLAEYISNADLCLAGHFNKDIDKARRTIPGKAYIYEMMQKKMILGDNIANHEVFFEDEKHRFVEMGNVEKLSQLILER
ncbi:MAG: glycosyltransferase [Lachnospiraceae bacterium]|nr:glycosyltransferase [Lachnospiraceae bacterium]